MKTVLLPEPRHRRRTDGRERRNRWRWVAAAAAAAVVVVALLLVRSRSGTGAGDPRVLVESNFAGKAGQRTITGDLENRTEAAVTDVHVAIGFFDASGARVGGAAAQARRIPAGDTVRFHAALAANTARYRVERLRWREGDRDVVTGPYPMRTVPARRAARRGSS